MDLKIWNIIFKIENRKIIENGGHQILSTKFKSENSIYRQPRRIIHNQKDCLSSIIDRNPLSLSKGIYDCILENRNYANILWLLDIYDMTNNKILDKIIIKKYCPLSSSIPISKPQLNDMVNSEMYDNYQFLKLYIWSLLRIIELNQFQPIYLWR